MDEDEVQEGHNPDLVYTISSDRLVQCVSSIGTLFGRNETSNNNLEAGAADTNNGATVFSLLQTNTHVQDQEQGIR